MDTIRNMKAFVAVAAPGGFTKAAHQLSAQLPVTSRWISELEVRLRTRLLNQIASRGALLGSGLGKIQWVVKSAIFWLHNFRRLCARFECPAFILEVFKKIACRIIRWRQPQPSLCLRFLIKLTVPLYLRPPMMHASSFPRGRI